jgi:hypothetical protein
MAIARSAEPRTLVFAISAYTPCCDSPCYTSEWVAGKYVLKCLNCQAIK